MYLSKFKKLFWPYLNKLFKIEKNKNAPETPINKDYNGENSFFNY